MRKQYLKAKYPPPKTTFSRSLTLRHPWLQICRRLRKLQHDCFRPAARVLSSLLRRAERIPDPELRSQALLSIQNKRFHAEGGAVYALGASPDVAIHLIELIVTFQTLSDYLDNLCDRSIYLRGTEYRFLHRAYQAAAAGDVSKMEIDYGYPIHHDDGGYLQHLVERCRTLRRLLPGEADVRREVGRMAAHYSALQTYKHLPHPQRERRLRRYLRSDPSTSGGVSHPQGWWEMAAACGSTLGTFALWREATHGRVHRNRVEQLVNLYWPGLQALHILLDYLIDIEEDWVVGDHNLSCYYRTPHEAGRRIEHIYQTVRKHASMQDHAEEIERGHSFHTLVTDGLAALYLSDPKALRPSVRPATVFLLKRLHHEGRSAYALTRASRHVLGHWTGIPRRLIT